MVGPAIVAVWVGGVLGPGVGVVEGRLGVELAEEEEGTKRSRREELVQGCGYAALWERRKGSINQSSSSYEYVCMYGCISFTRKKGDETSSLEYREREEGGGD